MQVAALEVDLRLPGAGSLKEKRAVLRHLLDTSRHRFRVSAAEVGLTNLSQRAVLGFAAVANDASHVDEVLERVERFVWSHPEIEVLSTRRHWLDTDGY